MHYSLIQKSNPKGINQYTKTNGDFIESSEKTKTSQTRIQDHKYSDIASGAKARQKVISDLTKAGYSHDGDTASGSYYIKDSRRARVTNLSGDSGATFTSTVTKPLVKKEEVFSLALTQKSNPTGINQYTKGGGKDLDPATLAKATDYKTKLSGQSKKEVFNSWTSTLGKVNSATIQEQSKGNMVYDLVHQQFGQQAVDAVYKIKKDEVLSFAGSVRMGGVLA